MSAVSDPLPARDEKEIRLSIRYYAVCRRCEETWFSPYCKSEDSAKRALRKHDREEHS